ncbi:unnamed protein product [Sphacelaria rigidula]
MPASVSPALQEFCNKIIERSHGTGAMDRSHGIGAVLIGTADGTPIVNGRTFLGIQIIPLYK